MPSSKTVSITCRSTPLELGGGKAYPGQPAIDYKVGPVDEAALITSEEEDGLRLLNSFAKAAGRKMDLAAMALSRIVTEPVLEECRAVVSL